MPAGLINRIELPAPEFFNPIDEFPELSEAELIDDTIEQTDAVSIDLEETGTNRVREVISIDGTGAGATPAPGIVVDIPQPVVEVLSDTLPLSDPLDAPGRIVDAVGDQSVTGIVDNLGNVAGDLTDSSSLLNSVSDDLGIDTDSDIVNSLIEFGAAADGMLEDSIEANTSDVLEDSIDVLDSTDTENIVDDIPGSLDSDVLNDTLRDITDSLPGI